MGEKKPDNHITLTEGQDHLPTPRLERQVRKVLRKFEDLNRRAKRLATGEVLSPGEADG